MQTMTEKDWAERRKGAVKTAAWLVSFCVALIILFVVSISLREQPIGSKKSATKTIVSQLTKNKPVNRPSTKSP